MTPTTLVKFAAGTAVVVLLAGCGAATTNTTVTSPTTPSTNEPIPAPATTGAEVASVTLDEYSFAPETLTLKKDVATTIAVTNKGSVTHNYVVPGLDIKLEVAAGQTESVTVTPASTGTFDLDCTIAGHSALGMHGSVVVE